jgi:tape measure domain-containing protein
MRLFGASSGELRQAQAQVKAAAVELVTRGLDPQSKEIKRLTEEYKRLGKEAEDLNKDTGKNTTSFKDLAGALRSLAEVAALTKTLGVIKDLGAYALSTADAFQTARNEFGILLGDMDAGAALFSQIKAFNDKTPFSLDTFTQATNVLLAAKVPLTELQDQLAKFGDLAQGNSQRFTSYVNAFSRAAARGRVDMETLNIYLNQGVPILETLAKQFGVTASEIAEMTGQGKIGFKDLSAALDDLTAQGGKYFGGMELGSRSLAAMQEGLKEAVASLAASFGEMLLPAAIEVVETLTAIANAINESPILKGGLAAGLVLITGYLTAMAVKAGIAFAAQMSLNFAIGALNPAVLAATVAVAGLAAGYTIYASHQQQAAQETEKLALRQKEQNETMRDATDIVRRYRQEIAGMTENQLRDQLVRLNGLNTSDLNDALKSFSGRVSDGLGTWRAEGDKLKEVYEELGKIGKNFTDSLFSSATGRKTGGLYSDLEGAFNRLNGLNTSDFDDALQSFSGRASDGFDAWRVQGDKLKAVYEELGKIRKNFIDSMLSGTDEGKIRDLDSRLGDAFRFLKDPGLTDVEKSDLQRIIQNITVELEKLNIAAGRTKKTWQNWLGEIIDIDPGLFGSGGAKAAELYLEGFKGSLDVKRAISGALGTDLNIADILRGEQDNIQKAIADLLSIDPDKINEPFDITSNTIKALIQRFKDLGAEIADIEYQKNIDELRGKIDSLGKSENDLTLEALKAKGATGEQLAMIKALMDEYDRKSILESYRQQVEGLTTDKYDLARAALAAAGATEEERQKLENYINTLKSAEGVDEYRRTLEDLRKKIDSLGKSENDLTLEMLRAKGATEGDLAAIKALMNEYGRKSILESYRQQVENLTADKYDLARAALAAAGATEEERRELEEHIATLKKAEITDEFRQTVEDLQRKIDSLGKSENDLALAALKAKGATEEELAPVKALMDEYTRGSVLESYRQQVESLTMDKYDLARATLAAAGATEEERQELEKYIAALKKSEGINEYRRTMEELQRKIDSLGKSENDLALEALKAKGATEEELAALKALMDQFTRGSILENYRQQVEGLTADKYDMARSALAAAGATEEERQELEKYIDALQAAEYKSRLEEAREDLIDWQSTLTDVLSLALMNIEIFSDQAAAILGDLSARFIELSTSAALDGFSEFGRAMGDGADAAESLQRALAQMARQILRQLPMMFLQAGLQLIANGQWALGLGFIAAAGSTAIISGYVDGVTENAKGGVYNEYGRAAREFAAGGAFTSQIVSRPTYFQYGGGLGVMGEAGPEAIVPLKRGGDGRLGISAFGPAGNTAVYVIIQNYTNEKVRTEESSDSSGNQIRTVIIGAVKESITSGEMDQPMSTRYGLRARGV